VAVRAPAPQGIGSAIGRAIGLPVAIGLLLVVAAARPLAADPGAAAVSGTSIAPVDIRAVEAAAVPEGGTPFGRPVADSLESLPISRIDVHPRNIFDPLPPGRLAPVLELANRLHVRTREHTVRTQLLMQRGDRWSDARGHETVRNLRALDFLVPTHIEATRDGDSAIVHVETRDVWSTSPEFNIESADGRQFGSIAFTERNFMGLGKAFSVAYRDVPGGRSRAILFSDPGVQGTRVQIHYAASDGAGGADDEVEIGQPFYAEDAPYTYGLRWSRATSVATVFGGGTDLATFNRRLDNWAVYWGRGHRGRHMIRRGVVTFDSWQRRFGPTQAVQDVIPLEFQGGEESLQLRRLLLDGRLWWPNYIERVRVNGFGLVEDFDVGTSATLGVGFAPTLLGSSQDEAFARGRLAMGCVTPLGFGQFAVSGSSRLQTFALESVGQFDARWVQQSRFKQTLVLSARGAAGRNVARDFQLTAGGLNGLRAYPVTAVAGRRIWRLNAENRWTVGERFWESVTLGAVTFCDAARAWGPGSGTSQWFVAAGAGLRINLPQWSLGQVMRIDMAWPIQPTRNGQRNPVLSFGSSQAF
jgi:hypothetical protein